MFDISNRKTGQNNNQRRQEAAVRSFESNEQNSGAAAEGAADSDDDDQRPPPSAVGQALYCLAKAREQALFRSSTKVRVLHILMNQMHASISFLSTSIVERASGLSYLNHALVANYLHVVIDKLYCVLHVHKTSMMHSRDDVC